MATLELPPMTRRQEASWRGIIAVASRVPSGWCLVGGQMVQLWCWEREVEPVRPTDPLRQRHLQDFAVLSSMIRISDHVGDGLQRKERNKLFMAYSAAIKDPLAVSVDDGAGLRRLAVAAWDA